MPVKSPIFPRRLPYFPLPQIPVFYVPEFRVKMAIIVYLMFSCDSSVRSC